jgi:hypothetical protein
MPHDIEQIKNRLKRDWIHLIKEKGLELKTVHFGNFLPLDKWQTIKNPLEPNNLEYYIFEEYNGLILDKNINIVSVPILPVLGFRDQEAPRLEWDSVTVEKNIGGHTINLWYYKTGWLASTKDRVLFRGRQIDSGVYAGDLKEKAKGPLEILGTALAKAGISTDSLCKAYTYMFRLRGKEAVHLGTRDNRTLKELDVELNLNRPDVYIVSTMAATIGLMGIPGLVGERGLILKDRNYNRIKIEREDVE